MAPPRPARPPPHRSARRRPFDGHGVLTATVNTNRDDRDFELNCWDNDKAAPPTISCAWKRATRDDFGGYRLVRTLATVKASDRAATANQVFQGTARGTTRFDDTGIQTNVGYIYQAQILDRAGRPVRDSEWVEVTGRTPPPPPPAIRRIQMDCWDAMQPVTTDVQDEIRLLVTTGLITTTLPTPSAAGGSSWLKAVRCPPGEVGRPGDVVGRMPARQHSAVARASTTPTTLAMLCMKGTAERPNLWGIESPAMSTPKTPCGPRTGAATAERMRSRPGRA